jgi:endonuclease/exonuclease/phosphatase (EEP) superfamily protein YafD
MLKILTWNCQGAFRKKYSLVAGLAPDLAVIQECESLERIKWKGAPAPSTALWFGDGPNKGVGVFSWSGLALEPLAEYDPGIRHAIPLRVSAPYPFQVVAIWAKDHRIDAQSYSAQVYQAIATYRAFIQGGDTVFLGDFNSSPRTTPGSRLGNHAELDLVLRDLWMVSAYHQFTHQRQGQETQATFFRARQLERAYHIDYAYIPVRWLRRLARVSVGQPEPWLALSDHMPLVVEVQEKGPGVIV